VYLAILLGSLAAGFLLGRLLAWPTPNLADRLTTWVLYLLVLTMGFRIGRTEEAASGFAGIGFAALGYAAATVAGTVLVLWLMFSLFTRPGSIARRASRVESGGGGLRTLLALLASPLKLLAILGLGLLLGRLAPLSRAITGAKVSTWVLCFLLFLIGITVRRSGLKARELLDPSLWILPVGTIAGSLAGGLALALALGQRAGRGLALAAGFGWYSLSGVLLIQLDGPVLGATAFLANLLRETMSLLLIPLLARTRFPFLAIGVGGATSMDVTLPLIEVSCGPRAVPLAIASGAVLSALVPVLVPLLYRIG
jgi:uncharacterized membrane protein YbjE (DUF340 family)